MKYCILVLGWIVFCLLHSILAAERSKIFFKSKMGDNFKFYRLIYSVIAIITLGSVLAFQFSIPVQYFVLAPFLQHFVALPCTIFAGVVMAVCIRKYFFRLSGVAVFYQRPAKPILETGGVHKFVRHPLYISTLILIWSLLLLFPSLSNLLACVMITIYVRIGIYTEERMLVQIFGKEYEDYRKRTPMLIPYKHDRLFQFITANSKSV